MGLKLEVFPLNVNPGYVMGRTSVRMKAGLKRALAKHGHNITADQWILLSVLWGEEGISQTEIARRTGKDRHTINRMLDVLERRGWLERQPDPLDRRGSQVYLTEKGREKQEELTPITRDYSKSVFCVLSQKELETLMELNHRIFTHLESMEQENE